MVAFHSAFSSCSCGWSRYGSRDMIFLLTHFLLCTLSFVNLWPHLMSLESFGIMFMVNGRNDHLTMFILHLPLAICNFGIKLISFPSSQRPELFYTIVILGILRLA